MNLFRRFWNWLMVKDKPIIYEDILVFPTPDGPEPPTPQPKTVSEIYAEIIRERAEKSKGLRQKRK